MTKLESSESGLPDLSRDSISFNHCISSERHNKLPFSQAYKKRGPREPKRGREKTKWQRLFRIDSTIPQNFSKSRLKMSQDPRKAVPPVFNVPNGQFTLRNVSSASISKYNCQIIK